MTPTSFAFTVSMPGDTRLVGIARQLTAQAAGYAELSEASRDDLAAHVERATEAAIAATRVQDAKIEYQFTADGTVLRVIISCEASASPGKGWSTEGARHTCDIHRPVTA